MTRPIGSLRGAKRAVAGELTVLGTGSRTGVLDEKAGVVYKVRQSTYCGWFWVDETNRLEHANSEKARALGIPGVPRTSLWEVEVQAADDDGMAEGATIKVAVLAMRFYPGDPNDVDYSKNVETQDLFERVGFSDLHYGNYRYTPGGRPRIIDMESFFEARARQWSSQRAAA